MARQRAPQISRALVLVLVLVLVPLAASSALASGELTSSSGGALAVIREEVHATIRDSLATTRVVEVFRNDGDRPLEAVYAFTLPRGASITDFTMFIEGRAVRGEVLERGEARRAYEALVRRARDPGLLEQSGERTFHARVFPVAPRSEQRFEVEYFERLTCEAGVLRYVYPRRPEATGALSLRLDVESSVPLG
ncbi:MAG TPA: VIT domain-containing protein, partial [Planctomycetota bacterium]|nr:VIT domain-containing protein [Planctomycetota bacterium]